MAEVLEQSGFGGYHADTGLAGGATVGPGAKVALDTDGARGHRRAGGVASVLEGRVDLDRCMSPSRQRCSGTPGASVDLWPVTPRYRSEEEPNKSVEPTATALTFEDAMKCHCPAPIAAPVAHLWR